MRFEPGMKVAVAVAAGEQSTQPHKQPFRGFGCDSVSLEGKAPLLC